MSALSSARAKSNGGLYHALPQAPVATAPVVLPDPEGEDLEDSGILEPSLAEPHPQVELDAKILWILFALGCAVLLPWNVIITAMPYFLSQLQGSSYRGSFGSYVTSSFTIVNFAVLAFATATSKQASQSRRITVSTLIIALLTLFLTLTTFFTVPPSFFFFLILANGILQAYAGGYLQTSVMVVGALFGPRAMQAVMSGQAAVAVIVSGVQVVSSAASVWGQAPESYDAEAATDGKAEANSAFLFFGLSTLFMLGTVWAYMWLRGMPAYKAAVEPMERARQARRSVEEEETTGLVGGRRTRKEEGGNKAQIMRVARANILAEAAVAWVFIVTLAVFPTITVTITPTNPDTHPLLFSAIHFFVFNVGDFVGRYSCSFPPFHIWSQRKLLFISLARTLFIPLFLMCNVQGGAHAGGVSKPPVINSDVLFIIILLACGLTTGYVSTMCIISASSEEHNKRLKGREDVDVAATVASFFLVGGLAVGSAASFLVRYWICGCNPFQS